MSRIRVCAVSFLNARPITYGLERGLGGDRFDLSFDIPSRCAEALTRGDVDLALVPSASYAADETLRVVPGIAVAGRGAVRTVLLCGEVPWTRMASIALDGASRSSAMLLRILCRDRKLEPTFREIPHDDVARAAAGETGALVIGDAGFEASTRYPYVYDLGQEWTRSTGLPFVYAVWAGRQGAIGAEDVRILQQSLDMGLAHRGEIARAFAEAHGVDAVTCERYLVDHIRYRLASEELSGAAAFFSKARDAGLLSRRAAIRFYDDGRVEAPITVARTAPRTDPIASTRADRPGSPAPAAPASGADAKSLSTLLTEASEGRRLSFAEGLRIYNEAETLDLGAAADARRRALHADGVVTYIIDRNVNYTNVCVTRCKFCNFYRPPGHDEGYTLSRETLAQKLRETVDLGGVQILLQGGLNPDLRIEWYEDLFRWMKANFPLSIHGLSPEEIRYIAELENLPIRTVLERLVAAGLDSVPGGGAEILDDDVRRAISPLKCSTETWLEVMRQAHALGLRTTATLVFGFGETPEQVLGHLDRLRTLQDETSGFTAYICWPFQAEGTRLKLKDDTSAMRYLRHLAFARLYLDNFPSMQVSWPTMGPEVGQVGLRFGGNDFGSAMIEENVVSQAGAVFNLSADDIERTVRAAGFEPRRRNMRYELLTT